MPENGHFPSLLLEIGSKIPFDGKEVTRQDAIFSFFSDNSVIQRITAMSGCLSWEEKREGGGGEKECASERNPAARGHLCIKFFQTSIFDCDPTDLSLKCKHSEAPKPSIV